MLLKGALVKESYLIAKFKIILIHMPVRHRHK